MRLVGKKLKGGFTLFCMDMVLRFFVDAVAFVYGTWVMYRHEIL